MLEKATRESQDRAGTAQRLGSSWNEQRRCFVAMECAYATPTSRGEPLNPPEWETTDGVVRSTRQGSAHIDSVRLPAKTGCDRTHLEVPQSI